MSLENTDLDGYDGNEHMLVKHELLESYLTRLLMIIGQKRSKRIVFVDGYAGPWKPAGGNYDKTSFARAYEIMRTCRNGLRALGHEVEMRALFIEKNAKSHQALRCWALAHASDDIPVETWRADFGEVVGKLMQWLKRDEFAFVLIDPTGLAATPTQLAPLLRRPNTEMLINLMWNFIVRFRGGPGFRENCADFFGDDYEEHFAKRSETQDRYNLERVRNRVRAVAQSGGLELRCARFPVHYVNSTARVRYYLFFITASSTGLLVFLEECEKQRGEQARIKFLVEERKTGIGDMFGDTHREFELDTSRARESWLKVLPRAGSKLIADNELLASLAEDSGSLIREVQEAFAELASETILVNDSARRVRHKNPVHFQDRESLRRIQ